MPEFQLPASGVGLQTPDDVSRFVWILGGGGEGTRDVQRCKGGAGRFVADERSRTLAGWQTYVEVERRPPPPWKGRGGKGGKSRTQRCKIGIFFRSLGICGKLQPGFLPHSLPSVTDANPPPPEKVSPGTGELISEGTGISSVPVFYFSTLVYALSHHSHPSPELKKAYGIYWFQKFKAKKMTPQKSLVSGQKCRIFLGWNHFQAEIQKSTKKQKKKLKKNSKLAKLGGLWQKKMKNSKKIAKKKKVEFVFPCKTFEKWLEIFHVKSMRTEGGKKFVDKFRNLW